MTCLKNVLILILDSTSLDLFSKKSCSDDRGYFNAIVQLLLDCRAVSSISEQDETVTNIT